MFPILAPENPLKKINQLLIPEGQVQVDTNKIIGKGNIVEIVSVADTGIKGQEPLYYINGVPSFSGAKGIKPENIMRINVLKGEVAAKVFGSGSLNGVIVITTKNQDNNPDVIELDKKIKESQNKGKTEKVVEQVIEVKKLQPTQNISSLSDIKAELIILDGKEVNRSVLNDLPEISIAKVEVIKGETAVNIYGEKGRKGVVLISTKK